jgi:DNA-binding MurR/RpiR family transcriptional regulator
MTDEQILVAKRRIEAKNATIAEMATLNDVHPSTVTRSIQRLLSAKHPEVETE